MAMEHPEVVSTFRGLPIPICLQRSVRCPPVCLPSLGDYHAIQILDDSGKKRKRQADEIHQACNLASGLSDIVIILERPRHRDSHTFDTSFSDFVQCCETLKALDDLIIFSSGGKRSIHTVTVLNAFAYQPEKKRDDLDKECETIIAKILQTKKPKVIVHCTRSFYSDPWLKERLYYPGLYSVERRYVNISKEHKAILIPSFHPSHAVNHCKHRPELIILLIHHFVNAFAALDSPSPCFATCSEKCAQRILELCRSRDVSKDRQPEWKIARQISSRLRSSYHGSMLFCEPPPIPWIGSAENDISEGPKIKVNAFKMLAFWLELLSKEPETFDLIGKVSILFPLKMFSNSPVYEQIIFFVKFGDPSEHWFADNIDANLSLKMASLRTSGTRDVLNENLTALFSLSSDLKKATDSCIQLHLKQVLSIQSKIYVQNQRIRSSLSDIFVSNKAVSIQLQALSQYCQITVDVFREKFELGRDIKIEVQTLLDYIAIIVERLTLISTEYI